MDLRFSDADLAFQEEVRSFLKENLPERVRDRSASGLHPNKDDIVGWQKMLHKQGWIAPDWPKELGGIGWSLTRKNIYNLEYNMWGRRRPWSSA